ncbi:hypothetical protein ACIA8O_04120 [Kitasatospora sp. NPDC051853]|uniref:hypothetical protein n=1 Tax=Kitasatospora sp. NPDC051853 TaxID=3364058 RepID=UPI0037A1BB10
MRITIGYIIESLGYVVGAQGLLGFVSRTFFGAEWGWLHKIVELPSPAHLGVVAGGAVLVLGGMRLRKTPDPQSAA